MVAEEVLHLAQFRLGIGPAAVSDPADAAEREATELAPQLVAGRLREPIQPATASVMRNDGRPVQMFLDRIQRVAARRAPLIRDAVRWGVDSTAVYAVRDYFLEVRRLIRESGGAFSWLLDQARVAVQEAYRGSLAHDLSGCLDPGARADVLGWI